MYWTKHAYNIQAYNQPFLLEEIVRVISNFALASAINLVEPT